MVVLHWLVSFVNSSTLLKCEEKTRIYAANLHTDHRGKNAAITHSRPTSVTESHALFWPHYLCGCWRTS